MLIKCKRCGIWYEGKSKCDPCPICSKPQKASEDWEGRKVRKICVRCKALFYGAPASLYCPECKEIREKEVGEKSQQNQKKRTSRKMGSIGICEICGRQYPVKGVLQKYCTRCGKRREIEHKAGRSIYHYPESPIYKAYFNEIREFDITDFQKSILLSELWNYESADDFVSEMANSSLFIDAQDDSDEVPGMMKKQFAILWKVYRSDFEDFLKLIKCKPADISHIYCVPLEVVQKWLEKDAPSYIRLMLARAEGILMI